MPHYYLSDFVGSGTVLDPYRVRGSEQPGAGIIDLRPDARVLAGRALLALPVRDDASAPGAIYLGDDALAPLGAVRGQLATQLGVTLAGPTLRRSVIELLSEHARSGEGSGRWKPLRPGRDGMWRVFLGGLLWEAPDIGGGSSFTESFNTSDQATLGPDLSWTEFLGTRWEVEGNQGHFDSALAAVIAARADHALAGDDHYCQVVVNACGTGSNNQTGPLCRKDNTATATYYTHRVIVAGATNEHRLMKSVAGALTDLGTDATDFAAGEILYVHANGSSIVAKRNGTTLISVTDTAIAGAGQVYGGLYGFGVFETVVDVDDWEATDLTTPTLAGQVQGTSTPTGILNRDTAMGATSAGGANLFATLSGESGLAGQVNGVAVVTGSLTAPVSLEGQVNGVATVTGGLGLLVPLAGVVAGVAAVSADGAAGGGSGPGGLDVVARPDTAVGAGTYSGAVSLWVDGEEVPRDDRKGLRYGSVVPGGDNHLSVDIDCRSAFFTALGGLPAERTNVEVKSELGDILWTGWVAKPVVRVAKGAFQGIRLEADGYQYSGLVEPFEDHQVYGPVGVGATSLTKLVTGNVIDAMDHARTQKTPLITNTRYALGAINFDEDTESFFRRTAVDVWNTVNAMISYIGNPMFWQVYSIDNLVTLEFFPHGGGADYFEQGRAKDMSLEFDADEVVWRAGVDFGGEQVFFADAAGGPAIATPYTQSKVVSLEAEAHSLLQVTLLAEKIVSDLNRRRITGGSITIDQPINTTGCANMPPSWLRAGRMIEVTIPQDAEPYHTADVGGPISGLMYIRSCEFSEDDCTAQLSASPWTDEAKAARVLPFQSTPGLTWGVTFGTFNPPPRVEKLPFVGSTPDPSRTPTLTPIVGSVIPTGYRSDGQHDYGPAGVVLDPRSQPKEVVSANYWVTGLITAAGPPPTYAVIPLEDAVIAQAIPEMVVERIELLAALGGPGSITLSFDKFVRSTETTSPLYLPNASLSSETFSETIVASADPGPGDPDNRLQFRTGDFIIINVIAPAPVNIKKLSVAIFGRKIWESHMPPTQGPNWVKRPATTSWPHNAGWN